MLPFAPHAGVVSASESPFSLPPLDGMAPHSANTEAERSGKFCPNSGEHNPDYKPFTYSPCCTLGSTENNQLPDEH